MEIAFIIIDGAILMLLVNILVYKLIVSRSLKKIIRPYLSSLGYKVDKVSFVGLFNKGDFNEEGVELRPFMANGNPMRSTYIYLYIRKDKANVDPVRITARVRTIFLFVRKVEYSRSLDKH